MPVKEYEKVWNLAERKRRIGIFFDNCAGWLLGGHNTKLEHFVHNDPTGDLLHFGIGAILEVKGANNSHGWLIYTDQLERHIEEAESGFPVNHCLYVLFGYMGRVGGRKDRHSLFEENGSTQRGVESVLARQTNIAYIVDARILSEFRRVTRLCHETWMGVPTRSFIPVTRRMLNKLAHDTREGLLDLALPNLIPSFLPPGAKSIRPLEVETVFRHRIMHLTVVPLLPLGQRRVLTKYLNGTVVRS
jgi:hypothetical protein